MTPHYTRLDELRHEAKILRHNLSEVTKSIDKILELLED